MTVGLKLGLGMTGASSSGGGAPAPDLTIVNNGDGTLSITSTEAGTCSLTWYADDTLASDYTASEVAAGTGKVSGTVVTTTVFVGAGTLTNFTLDDTGLAADTEYEILATLNIDDGGTYTDVVAVGYRTADDAFNIDDLFNGGRYGYRFDFDDTTTMWRGDDWDDTGGTAADTAGNNILSVDDLSGNNNRLSYAIAGTGNTSKLRAVNGQFYWENTVGNAVAGMRMEGDLDTSDVTGMSYFVCMRTTDDTGMLVGSQSSGVGEGTIQDGSSSDPTGGSGFDTGGTPTYHVDGGAAIASADRQDLYDNWATGNWVVAEIQDFTVDANQELNPLRNGVSPSFCLTADVIAIVATTNVTEAERAGIVAWMETKITNAETA